MIRGLGHPTAPTKEALCIRKGDLKAGNNSRMNGREGGWEEPDAAHAARYGAACVCLVGESVYRQAAADGGLGQAIISLSSPWPAAASRCWSDTGFAVEQFHQILAASRERYTRPRREVEEDLNREYASMAAAADAAAAGEAGPDGGQLGLVDEE